MISVSQCAGYADLDRSELLIGPSHCAEHDALLASYLLNLRADSVTVRDMIRADLRAFIDLGARKRAADLFLVLRLFLSRYPEARLDGCMALAASDSREAVQLGSTA